MSDTARLLDVNLNRASEAARLLEDVARFILEDPVGAGELKSLRHAMTSAVETLSPRIEAARVGREDVGRTSSTHEELTRASMESIVRAAASRLGQAGRVLEELAKMTAPDVARSLESMRYRGYDLSATVVGACSRRTRNQWKTCLLLTCRMCRLQWQQVLSGALAGGIECVQIREKEMTDAQLLAHARQVVQIVHDSGGIVIIDDRADIAVASDADGVHVGEDDLDVAACRELLGTSRVVGATAQSPDAVVAALSQGADYCGVGAIESSVTRPDRDVIGVEGFGICAGDDRIDPDSLVAIGGLDDRSVAKLVGVGSTRVAVSAFICGAQSPQAATAAVVLAASEGSRVDEYERIIDGP